MRNALIAMAMVLALCGCKLIGITLSGGDQTQDQNHHNNATPTPSPSPTVTPVQGSVSDVACVRVEEASGASKARITWTGTMPLTIVATQSATTSMFLGAVSPAELDPGPPGTGGGVWVFDLGPGLASCSVLLDT